MRALALILVRVYQRMISPLNPGACRYSPSCSEYAHEAIERHGVIRGLAYTLRRLSRCHPLGSSGYDPVP